MVGEGNKTPTINQPEEAQTGTRSVRTDEWTPERLIGFWAAMSALYGRSWVQDHGEDINGDTCTLWRAELMSMTPAEAALGWKACKASGDTRPCNMPMFTKRVSEALRAGKRPEVYKALPEPKGKRLERAAAAKEHLRGVRGLLAANKAN